VRVFPRFCYININIATELVTAYSLGSTPLAMAALKRNVWLCRNMEMHSANALVRGAKRCRHIRLAGNVNTISTEVRNHYSVEF